MNNALRVALLITCLCASCAAAPAAPEEVAAPVVQIRFDLHQLALIDSDPLSFYARFTLEVIWNPEELPDFDPDGLVLFNAVGNVATKSLVTTRMEAPPGHRQVSYVFDARFRNYNDYRGYPFDYHSLPIIVTYPAARTGDLRLDLSRAAASHPIQQQDTDGLDLQNVLFHDSLDGYYHAHPASVTDPDSPAAASLIELRVSRNTVLAVVKFLLPMLLVWGVSFAAHFRSEAAASPFGAASVIAVLALAISFRLLEPLVDYVLLVDVAITLLFGCIVLDMALVGYTGKLRREAGAKAASSFRELSRILSVLALIASALICLMVGLSQTSDTLFRSHRDTKPAEAANAARQPSPK